MGTPYILLQFHILDANFELPVLGFPIPSSLFFTCSKNTILLQLFL